MRVLITGITGMAGSHLADYLLTLPGVEVYGTYRWRSKLDNLEHLRRAGKLNLIAEGGNLTCTAVLEKMLAREARSDAVNLIDCELTDPYAVERVIGAVRPERIFHLAAQSFVPQSWNAPAATLTTNITAQVHLFEAIRKVGIDPLIQIAGSSEEYGLVYPHEVPMKETNPLRPLSPYAVSKVAQELLAWQYGRSYGLKCVVTRGFNHTGPRRGHVFVTSSFAKQVAEIERGLHNPPILHVGDLESKRDWTDVRDTVRGYWLALEKGEPGEVYNIGSGTCRSIGEMLNILLDLSHAEVTVEQDPARMRPSDVKILWADISKFQQQTGWKPMIPFRQTMRDLLDYWRERV